MAFLEASARGRFVWENGEVTKLRQLLRRKRSIQKVFRDESKLVMLNKIGEVHFRLLGTNGFSAKARE